MKKLFLIAVLVLSVVAGILFVDTTPRVPLAVGVSGVKNLPAGQIEISLWATNRTRHSFYGWVYCQRKSGGVRRTPDPDNEMPVTTVFTRPDGDWLNNVRLSQQSEPVILLVKYDRLLTPRETWCNAVATKLGLRPFFKPKSSKIITTALIEIPAR